MQRQRAAAMPPSITNQEPWSLVCPCDALTQDVRISQERMRKAEQKSFILAVFASRQGPSNQDARTTALEPRPPNYLLQLTELLHRAAVRRPVLT